MIETTRIEIQKLSEAIRICKEMSIEAAGKYPHYLILSEYSNTRLAFEWGFETRLATKFFGMEIVLVDRKDPQGIYFELGFPV